MPIRTPKDRPVKARQQLVLAVRARSCAGAFPGNQLNLGLLCHFQGVIDFDAQVPDRALQFRVAQ
jgi:hypothetical protein